MAASKDFEKFEQIVHRINPRSRLVHARALEGGISAQVVALEVARQDGQTEKMVMRRHGPVDLRQNPDVAEDEYRLLQITQAAGLATPAPYHLDQTCEIFPTPYVVIEYIEGETDLTPPDIHDYMQQMATHLAGIHTIACAHQDLTFLRDQQKIYAEMFSNRPEKVDDSIDEGRIRATLEAAWPLPQRNAPVLLHGDYWPGNVLWKDDRLAAVIDWEDAQFGEPLADVANGRMEIMWLFGIDAMETFTRHYRSITTIDFTDLPYWDLCTALRPAFKIPEFAEDAADEARMVREHGWFVGQAYEGIDSLIHWFIERHLLNEPMNQ